MSEALRRPLHSPALGIPDMWPAFARAKAVQALVGNKKWTTNPGLINATGADQILATLSMTALATGRFRVRASGVVSVSAINMEMTLGASHGAGVAAPDYAQPIVFLPGPPGEGIQGVTWFSLILDFSSAPVSFTAALGSTTALNLVVNATVNTDFETHGIQFEAEEF